MYNLDHNFHLMKLVCAAGPAISIDTACSSSLSGASMIAEMLRRGKCARGILTAALLTLDPHTIAMLTAANMLAPDGRCKTLDAAADGCAGCLKNSSEGASQSTLSLIQCFAKRCGS